MVLKIDEWRVEVFFCGGKFSKFGRLSLCVGCNSVRRMSIKLFDFRSKLEYMRSKFLFLGSSDMDCVTIFSISRL